MRQVPKMITLSDIYYFSPGLVAGLDQPHCQPQCSVLELEAHVPGAAGACAGAGDTGGGAAADGEAGAAGAVARAGLMARS